MTMLKGTGDNLRVLAVGVGIRCKILLVVFEVTLNFSKNGKGLYTGRNLEKADVPQALPASGVDKKNCFGTSNDI